MTFDDLLTTLHGLPRAEKVRAFRFLSTELAQLEGVEISEGAEYPIWSPFDSYEAAALLSEYHEQEPDR